MTKARSALLGLASLGLVGGAYLHDLHTTDAAIDAIRRAHAVECEAWSRPLPDDPPGAGAEQPGDAHAAINDVLRHAGQFPSMSRAAHEAVQTGAPLSPGDERILAAAAQPTVADVHAALRRRTRTRAQFVCGGEEAPLFAAIRVCSVVALAGEHALVRGNREEGTEAMVDALAFALEVGKQGAPIGVWVSAGLVNDSTMQLSRRWDELSPSGRSRIAALSWPSHADAALGAWLGHTTAVLEKRSPWWMPALVRDSLALDEINSTRPLFNVVRVAYADPDPDLAADRCNEAVIGIGTETTVDLEQSVVPSFACAQLTGIAKAERSLRALAARAAPGW